MSPAFNCGAVEASCQACNSLRLEVFTSYNCTMAFVSVGGLELGGLALLCVVLVSSFAAVAIGNGQLLNSPR
jgi:hypothetical protein